MAKHKRKIQILLFCIALGLSLLCWCGCSSDKNDDKAESTVDANGWTNEGCAWTIQVSALTNPSITEGESDVTSCFPELPDNTDGETLVAILEAYLGTYKDANNETIIISCQYEGKWEIPNISPHLACDYRYIIPIEIVEGTDEENWNGRIEQDYPGPDHPMPILEFAATLYQVNSTADETSWEFNRINSDPVIWQSYYPSEEKTWEKNE